MEFVRNKSCKQQSGSSDALSRAMRMRPVTEADNSRHPRVPHAHCGPKESTEMCPASPATTTTALSSPTEVCTGTARTKEQSQRRVFNLILRMVCNDRPTYKDRYARNSSWPGDLISPEGRIHLRRLVLSTKLALAVLRRTIHYQDSHYFAMGTIAGVQGGYLTGW